MSFASPRILAHATLLCAALLCGAPALALDKDSLAALRGVQAQVYPAVRQFHMETLLAGDPVRRGDLEAVVKRIGAQADSLPANTGDAAFDEAIGKVQADVKAFRRVVLANNVAKDTYTDEHLVGELYSSAEKLVTACDTALAAHPLAARLADAREAQAVNVLLQHTVAAYLERAAQMSPDIGVAIPFDIEKSTLELDRRLEALRGHIKAGSDAAVSMRTAASKWKFIRNSLLNYNEKSVPFIVDRYAEDIGRSLSNIVETLENPPASTPGPDFATPGAPG
jgi:hypothetical protein